MTWILLVRPEAERDLAKARDWYDKRSTGFGDEFLDEIARTMHELELHPTLPRLYFPELPTRHHPALSLQTVLAGYR